MAAARCQCGHDKAAHHFTGERLCTVCSVWKDRLTGKCMGWNPPGGGDHARYQVGLDPDGPAATRVGGAAGPPDLDHAIHAATKAIRDGAATRTEIPSYRDLARVAVEAAAPVLLQAMRDRLADLEDTARTVVACLEARNVTTALSLLTNALEAYPPAQEEDRSG